MEEREKIRIDHETELEIKLKECYSKIKLLDEQIQMMLSSEGDGGSGKVQYIEVIKEVEVIKEIRVPMEDSSGSGGGNELLKAENKNLQNQIRQMIDEKEQELLLLTEVPEEEEEEAEEAEKAEEAEQGGSSSEEIRSSLREIKMKLKKANTQLKQLKTMQIKATNESKKSKQTINELNKELNQIKQQNTQLIAKQKTNTAMRGGTASTTSTTNKRPLKMKNETAKVASLRKRLQKQILRYAVSTFKLVHLKNTCMDEKRINKELSKRLEDASETEHNFATMVMEHVIKIQQMAYRGQQRHELKVADARILMGRVRQRALRLLQSTKGKFSYCLNSHTSECALDCKINFFFFSFTKHGKKVVLGGKYVF